MKALQIEFDSISGKRAGEINPRDTGLRCYGWQNLESRPAKEIRVILDDREVEQYREISGVEILENDEEIEKAIEQLVATQYAINDELLFKMSFEGKGLKLAQLTGKTRDEIAKELFHLGILGIIERKPDKLKDIFFIEEKGKNDKNKDPLQEGDQENR